MGDLQARWLSNANGKPAQPANPARPSGSPLAGSKLLWDVLASYVYRTDGTISGESTGVKRSYFPEDEPQLATDLAKLSRAGAEDVRKFAEQWGMLGYAAMSGSNQAADASVEPEPLWWIHAHARAIQECFELLYFLRRGSELALERHLQRWKAPQDNQCTSPIRRELLIIPSALGASAASLSMERAGDANAADVARAIVSATVNSNVMGARPLLLSPANGGNLEFTHSFRAPIEVAYWHVGQAATQPGRIEKCRSCGSFFVRTSLKMRYCPPSPDERLAASRKGRVADSRCAARARMQKYRLARPDGDWSDRDGGER